MMGRMNLSFISVTFARVVPLFGVATLVLALSACDKLPGWAAALLHADAKSSLLSGPDENRDGIRDDIQPLISGSSSLPEVISVRTTYAKSLQKIVDFDFEHAQMLSLLKSEYSRSLACAMLVDDGFIDKLNSATFNTPGRVQQQDMFQKSISGQAFDFDSLSRLCN
jgi:hypothetical protein